MSEQIVIIGAGQAAAQAVTSLKAEGFGGTIVMVGDEAFPPYQRPPLSKAYLLGKLERERLFLKADNFYPEAHCEMLLGVSARAIDRKTKSVLLSDGSRKPYDKLLIATGTRVRQIKVPGAELPGVHYLRSIADVDQLSPAITPGKTLAVVGGGYIGLEVAAVARKRGLEVSVFEALDRLMVRAVSPQLSAFYEQAHRAEGVQFFFKTGVEAFEGNGKVERVRAGGKVYPADLVLVGIGAIPNVELAQEAGLSCDDGIVVDKFCTSISDPTIFAAGDCTRHHGHNGEEIRLECVQNAIDQAKHAALAMLGKPTAYREVPWFWSDQYDLKLQIAGLSRVGDELVVRGDPATRKFAVFHLRDGKVACVEAVNAPPEYIVGRKLIADGTPIAAARLADTTIPMKNIV
ncbi:MAG: FAD-dependent oxidoreductase [Pseudomonadota bacterium]|nr:FAD-dependent oxidoreductase [Pseudomonadota bacterium]